MALFIGPDKKQIQQVAAEAVGFTAIVENPQPNDLMQYDG